MGELNDIEDKIANYPFLKFVEEDKSHYKKASEAGYYDPDDLFLIGESGGFLMNIDPHRRFINTDLFCEMADFYRSEKTYTFFNIDSIPHRQFRQREEYRRKKGIVAPCWEYDDGRIRDCRITGGHYNFLNYTLMEQLNKSTIKRGSKVATAEKHYDFSKFIDAQFWTWHIMEFVVNNGFHLLIDKTRRGGFSYIMASDTANTINLNKRKVCIHVAANKDYLTDTGGLTDFTLNNLKFYENKTPFVRGIYSTNAENFKLGFKLPNGVESPKSWGSTLFSVSSHNNPNCAIGKDAIKVKCEEVSTMENFDDFMSVTEPAMRTGSYSTGTLFAWGTATRNDMQAFAYNFYNPKQHHFMPFENVWDKDARHEVCGYFKPYCWGLQGEADGEVAMDEYGNSDIRVGLKIAERERINKKDACDTFAEYINYLGQYANMPSESFSSTSENIFTSEELLKWEERLRSDNTLSFYVDGMLFEEDNKVVFKTNERIKADGGKFNKDYYDYIQGVPRKQHEHPHGCVRKWFSPRITDYTDKNGNRVRGIPPELYSITYDPFGVNKENKEITLKHSHASIKVWMNPHILNGFKPCLVASYYGRPETLEEADRICYLLAKMYNCIGTTNVETNRGETVSNFSKWKALQYLSKHPVYVFDTSIKGAVSNNYGYNIGDGPVKLEGLRFLKEMLYEEIGKSEDGTPIKFFETIYDLQSIVELKMWNATGNYDRVSEMLLRGIEWKSMKIKAEQALHRPKYRTGEYNKSILHRDWF